MLVVFSVKKNIVLTINVITLQKTRLKHGDEIHIVSRKAETTHSKLKLLCDCVPY